MPPTDIDSSDRSQGGAGYGDDDDSYDNDSRAYGARRYDDDEQQFDDYEDSREYGGRDYEPDGNYDRPSRSSRASRQDHSAPGRSGSHTMMPHPSGHPKKVEYPTGSQHRSYKDVAKEGRYHHGGAERADKPQYKASGRATYQDDRERAENFDKLHKLYLASIRQGDSSSSGRRRGAGAAAAEQQESKKGGAGAQEREHSASECNDFRCDICVSAPAATKGRAGAGDERETGRAAPSIVSAYDKKGSMDAPMSQKGGSRYGDDYDCHGDDCDCSPCRTYGGCHCRGCERKYGGSHPRGKEGRYKDDGKPNKEQRGGSGGHRQHRNEKGEYARSSSSSSGNRRHHRDSEGRFTD